MSSVDLQVSANEIYVRIPSADNNSAESVSIKVGPLECLHLVTCKNYVCDVSNVKAKMSKKNRTVDISIPLIPRSS